MEQRKHDGEAHPVQEDRKTSNGIYFLSRGHAPKIRWACDDGDIDPGGQIGVAVVGDPEVEDRWEVDRGVTTPVE